MSDVRKEVNFCKKTSIPILGVFENMRGFVCPCCKTESAIFSASTGGAQKLCTDFDLQLIGSVPLDPSINSLCDQGIYIGDLE